MKYKGVFLDVGGILIQIDWGRPFSFAGINDPRRRQELVAHFQGSEHFHLFEKGKITPSQFFAGFNDLFGQKREESFWREAWISLIIGNLPGVDDVFNFLKGRVPVYAVSNTNEVHYQFQLQHYPLMKKFDRFFASHELGERKPDAAYFEKVCALAGIHPNEGLFVDDTLENVLAAKRFGFTAEQTVNSTRDTLEFLRSHLP